MNLSTIFRIAAILLGIASATLMGVDGFKVPTNQAFSEVLDGMRELVGTFVWPFEALIVAPIVNRLHEQGLFFDLHDHWRHIFVLVWLYFGSTARALTSEDYWGQTIFFWAWGGVCALASGVLAGTVPLSNVGIFLWPLAGFALYLTLLAARAAANSRPQSQTWAGQFGYLVMRLFFQHGSLVLVSGAVGYLVATWPSPGLVSLTAFIGLEGARSLVMGARSALGEGDTWLQRFLGDFSTRIGLDILAVLGGATAIVYVAHLLA